MSIPVEHFPIQLAERPLRFDGENLDPAAVAHARLSRLFAKHRAATDTLLVAMARACFQIEHTCQELSGLEEGFVPSVSEALGIIVADLREVLDGQGVQITDLTGRQWKPEWHDLVDIRGHQVRNNLKESRIAHMELPIIHRGQDLTARGAVIIEGPHRG